MVFEGGGYLGLYLLEERGRLCLLEERGRLCLLEERERLL
jgi:hypothetical protein